MSGLLSHLYHHVHVQHLLTSTELAFMTDPGGFEIKMQS